ncbi:hypothetical protein [Allokutzneria oryzae]|uniref:Hedgehog/Intein (Hint) domain-containing protein n=1 Tax=Allokutzneria oryzae TaxID=1378989 RepID=A0ABV6A3E6_9PSEU
MLSGTLIAGRYRLRGWVRPAPGDVTMEDPMGSDDIRALAAAAPGTSYALVSSGGVAARPSERRTITFGRNRCEVHVRVGELVNRGSRWWAGNTGRLPIRMPASRLLFPDEELLPLTDGHTPLFVRASSGREHLLERSRRVAPGVPALRRDPAATAVLAAGRRPARPRRRLDPQAGRAHGRLCAPGCAGAGSR